MSKVQLNTMSLQELTDHYNSLKGVEKKVKLFRDKGTALERIAKMTETKTEAAPKEKVVRQKPDHKPSGAFSKLPEWIAFTSESDTEYRVRIRTKMVAKYGRPVDHNGDPMIASRTKVEELLVANSK